MTLFAWRADRYGRFGYGSSRRFIRLFRPAHRECSFGVIQRQGVRDVARQRVSERSGLPQGGKPNLMGGAEPMIATA